MERREYERENGHVNTGELFQLVIDHAQFAWLTTSPIRRLSINSDRQGPVTPEYTKWRYCSGPEMFVPTENPATPSRENISTPSSGTPPP